MNMNIIQYGIFPLFKMVFLSLCIILAFMFVCMPITLLVLSFLKGIFA